MDAAMRCKRLQEDALHSGYTLNADANFVQTLAEGLLKNAQRYGIESCPCRLFRGSKGENMDIVCPCDYRDDDLAEHGACFCALYVSDRYDPERQIPDRRRYTRKAAIKPVVQTLPYPVWRCCACGYLCANIHPPGKCPICGASTERFDRFL